MPNRKQPHKKAGEKIVVDNPRANEDVAYSDEGEGTPSVFACPECHGVLWELQEDKLVRFRCRVGHSYGMQSLAKELAQSSETALWAAMRALEEKAALQRRVADGLGNGKSAKHLLDQSVADEGNARLIRDMIFHRDQEFEPVGTAPTNQGLEAHETSKEEAA